MIKSEENLYRHCFTCKRKVKMVKEDNGAIARIFCPVCKKDDEIIFSGKK